MVWPEPKSSAAGVRIDRLIRFFNHVGWSVHISSFAEISDHSIEYAHAHVYHLNPNSPHTLDSIRAIDPDIVVFDRFIVEEQFGWQVAEACPRAVRILDTEDMHGLREARRLSLRHHSHEMLWKQDFMIFEDTLANPTSLRELASMYRVHLNLMVSRDEMDLVGKYYHVDDTYLYYLPLVSEEWKKRTTSNQNIESKDVRNHCVFIGNYKHAPNRDAVHHLCTNLWPHIRKRVPNLELHIYGAYADRDIQKLANKSLGITIKGRASDVGTVMNEYFLQLAPLRFGAGIKGKILEAIISQLPTITTPIGNEGLKEYTFGFGFPGEIAESDNEFIEKTVSLTQNNHRYQQHVETAGLISEQLIRDAIEFGYEHRLLKHLSDPSFIEKMLNPSLVHSSFRQTNNLAHKYLSKYIAEKNK